jgi:hypothetical protein
MATIDDRVERVRFLLGNRTDIDSKIIAWLGDAYLELGMSVPFEELEETENDNFIVGTGAYDYPDDARAIKALTGFVNSAPYPIQKRDIRVISRYMTTTEGVPAIWAPYSGQILVRPVPNDTYDFTWRFWIKPILDTPTEDTELLLPDDWTEVLDYMAAYRGHMALGEPQEAQAIAMLLHGDPKHANMPGLIKTKLLRREAENVVSDFALVPRVRPYSNV